MRSLPLRDAPYQEWLMGIRSTLASIVGGDDSESATRRIVEEVIANRGSVRPADLLALGERLDAIEAGASGGQAARIDALETETASLRKKLNMAMGAIQAATAQLADVRRASDGASADARQALARAESALATAESLSDGVEALEDVVEGRTTDDRIDVNTATAAEIAELDGIGPTVAKRVVAERKARGRFSSARDLGRVKGLGPATVAKLEDRLRF
ncbi:MAG: ComEA family DNA-binding protein [Myxococcota bacterium]